MRPRRSGRITKCHLLDTTCRARRARNLGWRDASTARASTSADRSRGSPSAAAALFATSALAASSAALAAALRVAAVACLSSSNAPASSSVLGGHARPSSNLAASQIVVHSYLPPPIKLLPASSAYSEAISAGDSSAGVEPPMWKVSLPSAWRQRPGAT